MPWYMPRFSNGTMSDTTMLHRPMIVPPPRPCIAREMISHSMFLAAPHIAEKTVNSIIAIYSIGLRPTISDTRPLIGVNRVMDNWYDVTTQEYCDGVALNCSAIVGSAVAMMVWSKAARKRTRPMHGMTMSRLFFGTSSITVVSFAAYRTHNRPQRSTPRLSFRAACHLLLPWRLSACPAPTLRRLIPAQTGPGGAVGSHQDLDR